MARRTLTTHLPPSAAPLLLCLDGRERDPLPSAGRSGKIGEARQRSSGGDARRNFFPPLRRWLHRVRNFQPFPPGAFFTTQSQLLAIRAIPGDRRRGRFLFSSPRFRTFRNPDNKSERTEAIHGSRSSRRI